MSRTLVFGCIKMYSTEEIKIIIKRFVHHITMRERERERLLDLENVFFVSFDVLYVREEERYTYKSLNMIVFHTFRLC